MGEYELRCLECGEKLAESYTLSHEGHKGLLRTEYKAKRLNIRDSKGVFRFYDWLPVRSTFDTDSAPVAFRNERLNHELGLPNLWIGFTGYYPERGARSVSCSFKEMEALPTYARLRDNGGGTIVVASAGNTARAFAETAPKAGCDCLLVVPERSKDRIRVTGDGSHTKLFTVKGDYLDAIRVADRIVSLGGFVPEGGARNVARRDGMGTVMLQGASSMGRIPDRFFQAVGSGTGGISAWEASLRLMGDGRFGDRLPRLDLAQNEPFVPMAKAWKAGRRDISAEDLGDAERDVCEVYSDVLTNRAPPYSMSGGVYDAMTACSGTFRTVSNQEARSAEKLWMSFENARPDPAASVAFASLIKAAENGELRQDEHILLNMTGGGYDRVAEDFVMSTLTPAGGIPRDADTETIRGILDARDRSDGHPRESRHRHDSQPPL